MIKEIDKVKEPPKLAIKFANIVFVLGILFSSLLIVYAVYKLYNPPEPVSPVFYIISLVCGGIFAIINWCPGAELNDRHRDFQSLALPTELPGLKNIR